jgi:magnesium transporter
MRNPGGRQAETAGLHPGALVHVGEKRSEPIRITYMDYDEHELRESEPESVEGCFPLRDSPTVSWINVDGVHEIDAIDKLGRHFGLHPLTLEDIVNTEQRPKAEDFDDYLFLVLRMPTHDAATGEIAIEQVSLILLPTCVVSFQEREGDVFGPVRERIRGAKGRIRKEGADYLAYALVDAIVDAHFIVLEDIGDRIQTIEDELAADPSPDAMRSIHRLKRKMIRLRKSVWPLREAVNSLTKSESPLIRESTGLYLRDVYDHTIQIIDTIESLRDMLSGLLDLYLSSVSNRMNEVMKVLTIIATMFIPLTFIAGVYGMNFRYMPELEWRAGYAMVWGIMAAVIVGMLVFFKRKRWF